MKSLKRFDIRNRDYFITCVTYDRRGILTASTDLFLSCWNRIELIAWVVLPDHFHAIVSVGDKSISEIMHIFKVRYSRRFRDMYSPGRVWQNRFWDHMIRDQVDMNRHLDYVHYNPVKHGLVNQPSNWELSSFHDYNTSGYYDSDWGRVEPQGLEGEYGE